jgi:hypothetical protein
MKYITYAEMKEYGYGRAKVVRICEKLGIDIISLAHVYNVRKPPFGITVQQFADVMMYE